MTRKKTTDRSEVGEKRQGNVRAIVRALTILKSFPDQPWQTLTEIATAADLDKGTARRLLLTLASEGFVVQDETTRRYGLGSAVRRIAEAAAASYDLRRIAARELHDLATELHVSAFLSCYRDHTAVCLEQMHDFKGMEVRWWAVGGTMPLNCGAAPRLLLAYQSPEEIVRALNTTLPKLTPRTVVSKAALRREFALIRERGWELAIDDVAVGLTALAVPVFDANKAVVAAISIAGLTPQMHLNGKPRHLERVLRAAANVAARLG